MRSLLITLFIGSFLFFISCSDSSKEDPGVDCSQSDLSVTVTDSTSPDCNVEGSITVAATGGSSPYTYSVNGVDFQSSATFTGLAAGSYTITVEDADGCSDDTSFVLEAAGSGISIDIAKTNSDCLDDTGSITVTASGGDGTFTYELNDGAAQSGNTFSSVGPGTYDVTVSDGSGCSATTEVVVTTSVSLENDIMPIIEANCLQTSSGGGGCHNGDLGSSRNFTIESNVISLSGGIRSRTGSGSMPPSSSGHSLTSDEIALIACWVADGANDN